MQGDCSSADQRLSRREIIRLAGLAGVAGGLSMHGLEQVAVAQTTKPTTKPAGNQSRNIDFELDKLIGLGDLTFRNAAGAFWIGFRNVKFSSPRDEEVQGLLEYVPYYRSGTVSVVAIDFIDAGGKTIARAKVECPSRSGEIEVGFPVFAFMSVEFHAFYAFYQQIAKFRLSLIEEAKTQETNVPETE